MRQVYEVKSRKKIILRKLLIVGVMLMLELGVSAFYVDKDSCPPFQRSYSKCEKLGGFLPNYFSSVKIKKGLKAYKFTVSTTHGLVEFNYIPDKIVRLGSDHHYLDDGTVYQDLPSHESYYCKELKLFGNELTILPDHSIAHETFIMEIDDKGKLLFEAKVNGDLLFKAACKADR